MFNNVLARKPRRNYRLLVWAPFVVLGLVLGQAVATITAVLIFGVISRTMPTARNWLLPALSAAYSQAAWFALPALLSPSSMLSGLTLGAALAGLTYWAHATRGSLPAAIALLGGEALYTVLSLLAGPGLVERNGLPSGLYLMAVIVIMPIAVIVLLLMMLNTKPPRVDPTVEAVFE